MKVEAMLKNYKAMVEAALEKKMTVGDIPEKPVFDAMYYSAMLGGKRIRPALMMEFCRICGGKPEDALCCAMGMEMIHTSSLIHDDLPCMDNDDMRRGKPSCHKAFSEDTALLAGDGLLMWAISVAGETELPDRLVRRAMKRLADAAGASGMVGGQVCDLAAEKQENVTREQLEYMHKKKTGALICASAEIGCILADADDEKISAALKYAENIGLVFQIVDDILDVIGDEALLGKPIGSDADNKKTTWVTLLGIEGAKEYAARLTAEAKESLSVLGQEAQNLKDLADMLLNRNF